jgi:S1-C subfamily serine protease
MSDDFSKLSDAIAQAATDAGASIVSVHGRRRQPASGILWSAEGWIVTANHVVERDENIIVVLPSGEEATAEIGGRDPVTDLALLRVAPGDHKPAAWANLGDLRVGHLVLALARPNGSLEATLGVVSSLGGPWRHRGGGRFDAYLQTDVTMYPGFSGGPLLTANGSFAGINSSALVRGASVTIPASTVRKSVEALLAHGHIPRAYLGVGVQTVQVQTDLVPDRAESTALIIMSVESDSPAGQAGLLQGDILLSLQGREVNSPDDLQSLLAEISAPTPVTVRILRGGAIQELNAGLVVR